MKCEKRALFFDVAMAAAADILMMVVMVVVVMMMAVLLLVHAIRKAEVENISL